MKIPEIDNQEEFLATFLREYLQNGMGVMSKREVDILVFHLLTRHTALGKRSNHELSIILQSTETKIKGLRYEAKLRYPPEDEKFIEKEFLTILARSKFDTEKNKIIFVVEDTYLRQEIQGRLKEKGMFADSSFNTELVKIDIPFLEVIIHEMYGDEVSKKFRKEFSKLLMKETKDEQKITFAEIKKDLIMDAISALGSAVTGAFIAYINTIIM